MAKPTKFGAGKVKQRTLTPGSMKDAAQKSFPNQGLPSNVVADKQANLLFIGALALSAALVGAGMFCCVALIISGFNVTPTNWFGVVGGVIGFAAMLFVARAAVWMSIFGAVMYAQKSGAWDALQALCERAMKLKKLIPGGATTAALLLIQGYISRGELDKTIELGQKQYEEFGQDPKQQQNLAPMYSTLGLAFYMNGAWRESITWNDRAIAAFNQLIEQFKTKKGFVAKVAGSQTEEWTKNMHIQLAMAHFNNGTNHFQLRNYRGAKENYRLAVEHANQAPDFPDKAQLLQVSKEQLGRLKHA